MSYIILEGDPYRVIGSSRTERQTINLELVPCEESEINEKVFQVVKYRGGESSE